LCGLVIADRHVYTGRFNLAVVGVLLSFCLDVVNRYWIAHEEPLPTRLRYQEEIQFVMLKLLKHPAQLLGPGWEI